MQETQSYTQQPIIITKAYVKFQPDWSFGKGELVKERIT